MQIYIFLRGQGKNLNLDQRTVAVAIASAFINILVNIYVIAKESRVNQLNFVDYALLSMQGRFGFTPFVDSIANGEIRAVDYTVDDTGVLYFTPESLRKLVAAVNTRKCRLTILKLGGTCTTISDNDMQLLWELYDVCAKKYVHLEEDRTCEMIQRRGEHVMRMACIRGYVGVLR